MPGVAASRWSTAALLAASLGNLACSADTTIPIRGSGASFPNPLYQAWALEYNRAGYPSQIDYQKKGSSAGIQDITKRHVHFGATDAPMNAEERARAPGLMHLPTVAGPVALVVNGVDPERVILDGATVAAIYRGSIRRWNAAKIAALNPGLDLPDLPIVPVRRADGSGTTYIFTCYLARVSTHFADQVGRGKAVRWPAHTLGGKGNDGVAQVVKNTPGAIGYVELKFARSAGLEPLALRNRSGAAIRPTVASAQAALRSAGDESDLVLDVLDAAHPEAYPIAGLTYLLVYDDLSYLEPDRARELTRFLRWMLDRGQAMAELEGFAPLSDGLRSRVRSRVDGIAQPARSTDD